jgi:hypothetical protein
MKAIIHVYLLPNSWLDDEYFTNLSRMGVAYEKRRPPDGDRSSKYYFQKDNG